MTADDAEVRDVTFVVFDDHQSLDLTGPLEVFATVTSILDGADGYRTRVVGPAGRTEVTSSSGLRIGLDGTVEDPLPPGSTLVVVGGIGTRPARRDADLVRAVDRLGARAARITSVCTGALLLGAAGVLDGLDATTHWSAYRELESFGATPTEERVVRRGKVITGAGVSAGIDMALTLVAELASPLVAQAIQLGIEYDPQPPFDAGAPSKAPDEVMEQLILQMADR